MALGSELNLGLRVYIVKMKKKDPTQEYMTKDTSGLSRRAVTQFIWRQYLISNLLIGEGGGVLATISLFYSDVVLKL